MPVANYVSYNPRLLLSWSGRGACLCPAKLVQLSGGNKQSSAMPRGFLQMDF
jgi:hypothetical protein